MARRLKAARRAVDRDPKLQAYFAELVAQAAKQHASRKKAKTIDVEKSKLKVEAQRAKKGLTGVPYEPPREAPPGPVEPSKPSTPDLPRPKLLPRAPEPSRPAPAPVQAKPKTPLTKEQARAIQEKIIAEKLKEYDEKKKKELLEDEEGYDYDFED